MKVAPNGIYCLLFPALFATSAYASILPPNKLHLEDNVNKAANMTQAEFDAIIDKAFAVYAPIVQSHGAKLHINHLWNDSTVNANASQSGNTWNVNMYGGLARRPEVTPDGFQAVVCHELGHHLGGFAFYGDSDWAANEGQSDYFTTHACLPKLWRNEVEQNARYRAIVDATAKRGCDAVWQTEADQNLCYRMADASRSLATLLAALNNGGAPRFETPDANQVPQTSSSHPAAQCRLDTYFAGSLCTRAFDDAVIPARRFPQGQTSLGAEELSTQSTCHAASGYVLGIRPRCWYKPRLDFLALRIADLTLSEQGNGNGTYEPGENVAFQLKLKNDSTNQTPSQVKGYVWSTTPGVSVINGEMTYPDLSPGQTATNPQPFVLGIKADAKCGSKVDVNYRATSNLGSVEKATSFILGRAVTELFGSASPNAPIPDNSRTGGVVSTIEVANDAAITSVTVDLDVTHTYVGDLQIVLTAPNGKSVTIWNREGGANDNIKASITKEFAIENASGTWKLAVNDLASGDSGKLNSWALKVVRHVCE